MIDSQFVEDSMSMIQCTALSICVERMMKEFIGRMLNDKQRVSSGTRCIDGKMRTFKNIKQSVLSILNVFLEKYSEASPGYELKIYFFNVGSSQCLKGLFNKRGRHEMLEVSDFDAVGIISPSLCAFVDSMCGLLRMAEVSSAMTGYIDMVDFVFRPHMNIKWTVESIQELRRRICMFEEKAGTTL